MFRVTREIAFCYGHRLLNYEGKCRHLHGHNGRAVITLEGSELDRRGMLVDFGEIKRKVQHWIDENLDHNMVLCRDDPLLGVLRERGERVFVMDCNPTAENIARLIYDRAREAGLPVIEVVLWETEHCCSTYYPGEEEGHPTSPKRSRVSGGSAPECPRGRVGLGGGSFPPGESAPGE